MQQPVNVDLPHSLGREEAKRRIGANIHTLKDHIPGGTAEVQSHWQGDELNLTVQAMGQTVEAKIGVDERVVHCHLMLPGMLAMLARPIAAMLEKKGGSILLEDHCK
jgi:hypothetical protein